MKELKETNDSLEKGKRIFGETFYLENSHTPVHFWMFALNNVKETPLDPCYMCLKADQ